MIIKYTEDYLFNACKERLLNQQEWDALRNMSPKWGFVFRGKK